MAAWLDILAWLSLAMGFASTLTIIGDLLAGHRQQMWIMNLVWPITALYAGPLALWGYFTVGRSSARRRVQADKAGATSRHRHPDRSGKRFRWPPRIAAAAVRSATLLRNGRCSRFQCCCGDA